VSALILLTVLGSIGTVLPGIVQALAPWSSPSTLTQNPQCPPTLLNATTASTSCLTTSSGSNNPQTVGADAVQNPTLPRTVLSSVDTLIGAGGIIQDSFQNLTLYNSAVIMRMLGGPLPHDELLASDHHALSSWSFWGVEANMSNVWVPLIPRSNSFTILGTNRTGTYVVRQMEVGIGSFSGTLKIAYKATTAGPLKWDLDFTASAPADYRLVYTWQNVSSKTDLSTSAKSFRVGYRASNYTLSWSDIPQSFNVTTSAVPPRFTLSVELGHVATDFTVSVDPSIVSSSTYSGPVDYPFQRKIFQDAEGRYFIFYYDGYSVGYSSSSNGITWSSKQAMPSGWPAYRDPLTSLPSVANYGERVIVAAGNFSADPLGCNTYPQCLYNSTLPYSIGTISGGAITWGPVKRVNAFTASCSYIQTCTVGAKYVYAMLSPNGDIALSYDAYNSTTVSYLNQVNLFYARGSSNYTAVVESGSPSCCYDFPSQSVVLPDGDPSAGVVRVVYENVTVTCCPYYQLYSRTYSSVLNSLGTADYLDQLSLRQFSVASDAEYGIHLIDTSYGCGGGNNGAVCYRYHPAGGSWTASVDVFQGSAAPSAATITVDQSTDTVYVLGFQMIYTDPNWVDFYTLLMRSKSPSQDPSWHDATTSNQFKFRAVSDYNSSPTLVSSLAPASSTNSSSIGLVWAEGKYGPYNVTFGAIPLQTVWSPYAFPTAPWDGNGIAPYGQYFHSLDESVSPGSGMLTVTQADLSVPGRGMNLEITRVFNGASFYPPSTPVPIGAGWGLNFPWYDSANNMVHLWNGESYRFPADWLTGCFPNCKWENHQGEFFRLVQNSDYTIDLITKAGVTYHFGTTALNLLLKITDQTGNNFITFNYNGNSLSSITDTVGRVFLFCYNSFNYISSIDQVSSGSCASETGFVRRVSYNYGYMGFAQWYNLTSVSDAAGRLTQFRYLTASSPYVISRITYPTGWYSNYAYTQSVLGNENIVYRVSQQTVYSSTGSIIRQFAYAFYQDSGTDQITRSTVTAYNGTSIASYIDYSFSYAGVKWNVSDASHHLVRGTIQLFGVQGDVPQEIILVTDGTGQSGPTHIGSYTNYYRYDFWGDLIYTHTVINPSAKWYHDSFNAYYNNGLPPGFNAFQETFSQLNGTFSDNPWLTYNGTWRVRNGAYNGTSPIFNPTHQEGVFAWSNFTSPNISIIASIYVTKPMVSSDRRVGLIAHYPGNGMRKWALVLHNSTGGVKLSLLDEYVAWKVENPCTLNYNSWYQFNFTISGKQAWGKATAPGVSCSVSGSFTSNDITSSTGLGLYAGGYAALFDNVTVTTIAPGITGTSFSNSFIPGGSPNSNAHGFLAGRAELQNGTGTTPIETYYGYASWGGLNQAKTRLDASGLTQWLQTTRTYDAFGNLASVMDPRGNFTYLTYSASYQFAYLTNETQVLNPGSTKITQLFTYDMNLGTLRSRTDPNGNISTYQYDILGRLTSIDYPTTSAGQPQVDGSALANCSNVSQSCSVSLQTSHPNDIIIVFTSETLNQEIYGCRFAVTDTAGLSWTARSNIVYGRADQGDRDELQEFYAKALGTLSSDTITESISGCGNNYNGLQAFAISGANFSNPFDTNSALPGTGSDGVSGQQATTSATISTSNANDFVFAGVQHGTPAATAQSGFMLITSDGAHATEYRFPNSVLTNYGVIFSFGVSSYWEEIADAIQLSNQVNYPDHVKNTYNDAGNFVDITNEHGWQARQIYDGLGRLSTIDRFLGSTSYSNATATYDYRGNKLSSRDPLNNIYSYTYDALGRVTSSTGPDGKSTMQSYNDTAPWVRTTDHDGNYRCGYSDRLGRLLSVVEYADSYCHPKLLNNLVYVTNYAYDEVGNLRKVTNAATKSTTYSYDNLNRQTTTIYPDGTSETYSYDSNGNLVRKVDRAGVKTLSSYDSVNRVSITTYCGTTITGTSYAYDKNSNPLQILNQNATVSYIYDSRNRVLNETYAVNPATRTVVDLGCSGNGGNITRTGGIAKTYAVGWTYSGELLNTLTYPTSTLYTIKYAYDGLGRVLNVTQLGTSTYYARSLTYYKNDQVKGFQFGNNLIQNYTYDNLSRPSMLTLSGKTTMSLTYAYNNTGTVRSVTGSVNGTTVNEQYRYDPLQRLTNSTVTSSSSTTTSWYEYDNLGNRVRQKLNSTITRYSYNSISELTNSTTYSNPQVTTAYSYDPNGNLKTQNVTSTGTIRWAYAWDASGRLLTVTNSTGQVQYAYDGSGRMVEAIEGGSIWRFAYTGTDILYKDLRNMDNYEYVYASGLRIVMVIDRTSTYYYHADALGSVRVITYSDAAYVYINNYQPFGKDNGTPKGTFQTSATDKFAGERWTAATGLYYNFQRWYDPSVGRFISQDPLAGDMSSPQTLDAYTYASDSPTTIMDPTGLSGVYVSARSDPCRNSKDFWSHLGCSFTNPQAIIIGLAYSPEGAALSWGLWGLSEGAPYIVSGGLAVGAVAVTAGYEFFTGQLKLPDTSWWNDNDNGLRTGITRTGTGITGRIGSLRTGGWAPTITGPTTGLGNLGRTPDSPWPWPWGSLVKAIHYVQNHPDLGKLCGAAAVVGGTGLIVWESIESSRQGLEPPDPEGIIKGAFVGCLAGLGAAALVPH